MFRVTEWIKYWKPRYHVYWFKFALTTKLLHEKCRYRFENTDWTFESLKHSSSFIHVLTYGALRCVQAFVLNKINNIYLELGPLRGRPVLMFYEWALMHLRLYAGIGYHLNGVRKPRSHTDFDIVYTIEKYITNHIDTRTKRLYSHTDS